MIEITLPLAPCACPRPRVTRFGNVYYPKPYEAWKKAAKRIVQALELTTMQGALSLECHFYTCVPKSYSKKKREQALAGLWWPRPDFDNMTKAACDLMNDCKVWEDDSQVVKASVTKQYALADSIVIRISHV